MTKTIHAIFVNGVLKPVESLDLPENCQVELTVVERAEQKNITMGELMARPKLTGCFPEDAVAWQRRERGNDDGDWMTGAQLRRFVGILRGSRALPTNPVEWQRQMRDEEWL